MKGCVLISGRVIARPVVWAEAIPRMDEIASLRPAKIMPDSARNDDLPPN
jgi:hypothetical protein